MKLQQLRYAVEVYRRNLNVSEAADALFTSQPGVSKQIRMLEEELGVPIFIRSGKRIVAVTQAGEAVLETAAQILRDVQKIKNMGSEFAGTQDGFLTVASTHSFARYRLPETVAFFQAAYPDVILNIKLGSSTEITEMVCNGEADLAVGQDLPDDKQVLRRLPCGAWHYALLMQPNHALTGLTSPQDLRLQDIADLPLLADSTVFQAGTAAARAFTKANLPIPHLTFASTDAELLKDYVRLGLGVALLDSVATQTHCDSLQILDVRHLFEASHCHIALRTDTLMRACLTGFIGHLAPDLTPQRVEQLLYAPVADDFSI
ncbi:MAG: LysR substrate-binding domain-containing protein [Alysiella sp.]|uniref:LysR substrate-binding domain-containing protein n=1 Tax=Alysiella sp. TaxID=1872483 RepID=UPI0026DCB14B|nr:LysR substrate-binding domain-containing protein [Alysiella sp.]MDO4433545.1 LysR substrate-binding domain-containing protein [Alysiella sp.]